MTFSETDLPGCYEIELPVFSDQRGKFIKTLSHSRFAEHGLATGFVETFHTISGANVLRGM
ncbi:MAG: dTDP-4-dehydrorhamnose 3,5-epimerase family protein, partial [Acidobacteriaceae bacterium]